MSLVRQGDAAAFEVVYARHATAAFSLVQNYIVGPEQVADGKPAPASDFILDGKEHQEGDFTRVTTSIDAMHLKNIDKPRARQSRSFPSPRTAILSHHGSHRD